MPQYPPTLQKQPSKTKHITLKCHPPYNLTVVLNRTMITEIILYRFRPSSVNRTLHRHSSRSSSRHSLLLLQCFLPR